MQAKGILAAYKALLYFTTPRPPFQSQNEPKWRKFLKKRHFFIKHPPMALL